MESFNNFREMRGDCSHRRKLRKKQVFLSHKGKNTQVKGEGPCPAFMGKREKTFDRLYRAHYPAVFNRLYRLTGRLEDAEDICQEVFAVLYRSMEKVREDECLKWLMGTARNLAAAHYRSKGEKTGRMTSGNELDDSLEHAPVNGYRELRIIIREEIENGDNYGDETDRAVFQLVALFGYTYRDAARQLGLTARQVNYRYGKVIGRILESLRKKGIREIGDIL